MSEKYMDKSAPIEERIDDLLSRMTLEEKVGQLTQVPLYKAEYDKVLELVKAGKAGSCILAFSCWAGKDVQEDFGTEAVNRMQRAAMEEARLHIPLLYGRDIIHGNYTEFPIPLALASSWNPAVIKDCGEVMALEAYCDGVHWTFAPMLDMSRDPRWGRIAESPGEDPALGAMFAEAMVKGIQGNDITKFGKLAACAKHYIGYGASEGGRDYSKAEISDYSLRNYYLASFKAAVDAGIATVMNSFNEISGQPTASSEYHIRELLKTELGFDGLVVSDWFAIKQLISQRVAENEAECAALAIKAGIDVDMSDNIYMNHLERLVNEGIVDIADVDDSVRRVLRVKFRLGLFDDPYFPTENKDKYILTDESLAKAQRAAEECAVLLKNNGVLPLSKDENVSLTGSFATDKAAPLGCWAAGGRPEDTVTLYDGMRQICKASITLGGANHVQASYGSLHWGGDVAVIAVGEIREMTGEAVSLSKIELDPSQVQIIRAAKDMGKKVVAVVYTGRPLALTEIEPYCDAIVLAWHNGTMGGLAAARILYGEVNPSGRLPVTMPRSTGQIPIYYNHPSNSRKYNGYYKNALNYADINDTPLFPFGYGLSYTNFDYGKAEADASELTLDDIRDGKAFGVSVTVTNSGDRDGYETVQCYVSDLVASMTRPVKELKAFEKVWIPAGESRIVKFVIGEKELRFYGRDGKLTVEPGKFEIQIGKNCKTITDTITVTVK